ncbi:MAG: WbqC family protein [Candidatus Omnitrophica bacterium]|nr:WbqC family protein [Candidatus Omnitrophota bacterium]
MILTGHQPNYLPYLGFFHKIAMSDVFVIVDTVQFVKRGTFGWMHRNKIRTPDGWQWLSLPVLSKGKFTQSILEAKINNATPWRRKHWKTIEQNYKNAPYLPKYAEFFRNAYEKEWEYFAPLSESIIRFLIKALDIKVDILKASELGVSPKNEGNGTDLIIELCKKTKADTYLHGPHGRDYINEAKFKENSIKCVYQSFEHPVYNQLYEPFIPNMAIIDLLFNHGEKSLAILTGKKP